MQILLAEKGVKLPVSAKNNQMRRLVPIDRFRTSLRASALNPPPYVEVDFLDTAGGNCSDCDSALRAVVKMIKC